MRSRTNEHGRSSAASCQEWNLKGSLPPWKGGSGRSALSVSTKYAGFPKAVDGMRVVETAFAKLDAKTNP
jgi:hypothetical protein